VIADATDPRLPVLDVNPAFERMTGYSSAEMKGRSCSILQGKGTDPGAVREMRDAIREGRECRVVVLNFRKDSTPFWCEVHLAPVRDNQGRVVQYVGVQNDVSERVNALTQLREQRDRASHLARHDPLTGLPNRHTFAERAEADLDGLTESETAAMIFIDIDRFKRINDRYGHSTGDELLTQSAAELQRRCGPDALLARQSGDEFLVFFTSPDPDRAAHRAEELVTALSERLVEHSVAGVITASAGWSLSTPGQRLSFGEMLSAADAAMYARKDRRPALALHGY
jgi:diguanylate cyclase (GGDEF)-like protein/PAS domain S-box-containing protein